MSSSSSSSVSLSMVKFDGKNFDSWRTRFVAYLLQVSEGKKCMEVIKKCETIYNTSIGVKEEEESKKEKKKEVTDVTVTYTEPEEKLYSYIILLVTDEIMSDVLRLVEPGDGAGCWLKLLQRYERNTSENMSWIYGETLDTKLKENELIEHYVARIKLNARALANMKQKLPEQLLIQLVYKGLPEDWKEIIRILRTQGDLSLDEVERRLSDIQKQDKMSGAYEQKLMGDSAYYAAKNKNYETNVKNNSSGSSGNSNKRCHRCQKMGHIAKYCRSNIVNTGNKVNPSNVKNDGQDKRACWNCGKVGHVKAKCRAPPKQQNNNQQSSMSAVESKKNNASGGGNENKENNERVEYAFSCRGSVNVDERVAAGREDDMMLPSFSSDNDMMCEFLDSVWSVVDNSRYVYFDLDSGSTRHLVNDISLLSDVRRLKSPMKVVVANGDVMPIHQVGNIILRTSRNNSVRLCDVGFSDVLPCNLISVSRITGAGYNVDFGATACMIWKPRDDHSGGEGKNIVAIIPKINNLFKWRHERKYVMKSNNNVINSVCNNVSDPSASSSAMSDVVPVPARVINKPSDIEQSVIGTTRHVSGSDLWHYRFGHGVSVDRLILMQKYNSVDGMKALDVNTNAKNMKVDVNEKVCDSCVLGRSHRHAFHSEMNAIVKATHVLERIHTDLCEVKLLKKYHNHSEEVVPTLDKDARHILVLIDEWTRMVFVSILCKKSDAVKHITQWCQRAKVYQSKSVKELHADGGKEFVNRKLQAYCTNIGILLTSTQPYTPQHNGIAERMNRTLLEMARCMLLHAKLPSVFIYRAICTAAYLHNRCIHKQHINKQNIEKKDTSATPTNDVTDVASGSGALIDSTMIPSSNIIRTPYELWSGKKPNMKHIRVFGSDCYVHIPKEKQGDKSEARAQPCIFVGYHSDKYEWHVYNLVEHKLMYSRDVKFNENCFTFRGEILKRGLEMQDTYDDENELNDILGNIEFESELQAAKNISRQEAERKNNNNDVVDTPPQPNNIDSNISVEEKKDDMDSVPSDASVASPSISVPVTSAIPPPSAPMSNRYDVLSEEVDEKKHASDVSSDVPPHNNSVTVRRSTRACVADASAKIQGILQSEKGISTSKTNNNNKNNSASHKKKHVTQYANNVVSVADSEANTIALTPSTHMSDALSDDPRSYNEAMNSHMSDEWKIAMDKEMKSHDRNGSWKLIDIPIHHPNINVIGCRWVYKLKRKADGSIDKYKARLVARGDQQIYGVDYFETYAAVLKYKTFRLILILVTSWDYELKTYDVETAYLQANIKGDVYMKQPQGYEVKAETSNHMKVCKLIKAVYGTPQAGNNWNGEINGTIVDILHYQRCVSDTCLYVKRSRSGRLMLLGLFVDDLKSAYHRVDEREWKEYEHMLCEKYKINGGDDMSSILGMRVMRDRSRRQLTIDQTYAITTLIKQHQLLDATSRDTPEQMGVHMIDVKKITMLHRIHLSSVQY